MNSVEQNPYEPPSFGLGSNASQTDERLVYSADVSTADLYLASTSVLAQLANYLRMIVATILLLPFGILLLGSVIQFAMEGRVGSRVLLVLLLLGTVVVALFILSGLRLWSGQILASRLPHLLSHRTGWLSRSGLYQVGPDSSTEWNMEMLQSISVNRDYLLIRFHPNAYLFDVIPLRSFERPEAALALVHELQRNQKPSVKGYLDPRRTMEVAVPDGEPMGADAISFSGLVTTDDLCGLPAYFQLRRSMYLLLAFGIGIPILVIGLGWSRFSWLTLTSLLATWILWKTYRISIKPLLKSNIPIQFAAGHLDGEKVSMYSFPEKSIVYWNYFKSMQVSDLAISLEHKSGSKFFSVLARRQFASDSDWDKAIKTIREKF